MPAAEKEPQPPASPPQPRMPGSPVIALVIVFICIGIAILAAMGYIPFPFINALADYAIEPPATVGEYRSIDFSGQLIPLLGFGASSDPAGYTFYVESGAGDPPPGLVLGSDGILKGTPTGAGGNFQVCVRDAGGRTACRTYHLDVVAASPGICPTELDPPCRSRQPGGEVGEVQVAGAGVPEGCLCPMGSHPGGVDTTSYPGHSITICVCDTPVSSR